MLFVNNPGSWSAVYSPLLHADWHGLTPTDLVFPFFLFVVGAAMACSLRPQLTKDGLPWISVFRRTALLISIGVVLNILPFDQSPENWRLLGVLQRIGLCFLLVAIVISLVAERFLMITAFSILILYSVSLTYLPTLVFSMNSEAAYSLPGNLVRAVDIAILGESHMWQGKGVAFDPEGLFSTISSAVSVLSGYIICIALQARHSVASRLRYLVLSGSILLVCGLLWSYFTPINKSLWTSSYVLVSSALACLSLAIITLLWDHHRIRFGLKALQIYGSNPIFIYVAAWVLSVILGRTMVSAGDAELSVQQHVFTQLNQFLSPEFASFIYATLFALLFYGVSYVLYKKQIFIKL